jgi:hypothetical protein
LVQVPDLGIQVTDLEVVVVDVLLPVRPRRLTLQFPNVSLQIPNGPFLDKFQLAQLHWVIRQVFPLFVDEETVFRESPVHLHTQLLLLLRTSCLHLGPIPGTVQVRIGPQERRRSLDVGLDVGLRDEVVVDMTQHIIR